MRLSCIALWVGLLGCLLEPTQLVVWLDADQELQAQLSLLTIEVSSPPDATVTDSRTLRLCTKTSRSGDRLASAVYAVRGEIV